MKKDVYVVSELFYGEGETSNNLIGVFENQEDAIKALKERKEGNLSAYPYAKATDEEDMEVNDTDTWCKVEMLYDDYYFELQIFETSVQ